MGTENEATGIALVLGGGAPNLTMMAGAVAALDECGVKFDVISTSGAGMLIGLLYAAPKDTTPQEALAQSVNMGVHDAIYNIFPVNFKVFHKPGQMAQTYTKYWQHVARHSEDWMSIYKNWMSSVWDYAPEPIANAYRDMFESFWSMVPGAGKAGAANEDAERFFNDCMALMLAALCPSDLSTKSQGLCQPAPFVDEVVDFEKLKEFEGEFYLSAYCIEDDEMVVWPKEEITLEHFQAALSFPLIYSPFKLNGKTYLEGAARDTLNFEGLMDYRERRIKQSQEQNRIVSSMTRLREEQGAPLTDDQMQSAREALEKEHDLPKISTIIVLDILGIDKLIDEPRSLYDAWVRSIIVPLVAISKDDIKLFEELHKADDVKLIRMSFAPYMPEEHWPNVLDWSYSNLKMLYDVGYQAGKAFYADPENRKHLHKTPKVEAADEDSIDVMKGEGPPPSKPKSKGKRPGAR